VDDYAERLANALAADGRHHLFSMVLIDRAGSLELSLLAASGDIEAMKYCQAVDQAVGMCLAPKRSMTCVFCDHEFSLPYMPACFAVLKREGDDVKNVVVNAICEDCNAEPRILVNQLNAEYRKLGMLVTLLKEEGHA
jgi:hypothetical protein